MLAVVLALSAVSCGSGNEPAAKTSGTPPGSGLPIPQQSRPVGIPRPTLIVPPSGAAPAATAGATEPSPSPFPTPWTPEIPVQASIQPACVVRGGTATITIVTQPKAGVAYHAVYAGTKGGAPPPYGHGYGGDAGGFTDGQGRYTSSWVVSPAAPVGQARADVIVGWDEKWGYDDPPFAVAGSSGTC